MSQEPAIDTWRQNCKNLQITPMASHCQRACQDGASREGSLTRLLQAEERHPPDQEHSGPPGSLCLRTERHYRTHQISISSILITPINKLSSVYTVQHSTFN